MAQTELPGASVNNVLTYKGFEFSIRHIGEKFACHVPSFNGGCMLAGTHGATVEETLIRTTSILNNAFIQPAVTKPRVGDLFGDDPDTHLIIVAVEPEKIKLIPLKDARILRRVAIVGTVVQPYLLVQNKVEDLSNEIEFGFEKYVILEDGVLHTNNFPMDVFVWKGLLTSEAAI